MIDGSQIEGLYLTRRRFDSGSKKQYGKKNAVSALVEVS
jgi:hypothetical protein